MKDVSKLELEASEIVGILSPKRLTFDLVSKH